MLNTRLDRQAPTSRAMAATVAALAVIVIPAASFQVSAQDEGPRTLTGYVYDSTGLVLPAAEMTLIDERLLKWSALSDGSGTFEFAPVGAGKYVLEVAVPGFRPLSPRIRASGRERGASVGVQPHAAERRAGRSADDRVRAFPSGGLRARHRDVDRA